MNMNTAPDDCTVTLPAANYRGTAMRHYVIWKYYQSTSNGLKYHRLSQREVHRASEDCCRHDVTAAHPAQLSIPRVLM